MKTCHVCKRIYVSEADFFRRTSRFRICSQGHLYFNCSCDGTVMVPNGKYGWFDPRKVLPSGAALLWERYQELRDLPSLPSVCLETQLVLDRPEASVDEIVGVIRLDPHFASRVLVVADVSRPKHSAPIRSLAEAIGILGRKRLKELALLAAVSQISFKTSAYTLGYHLRRSFLTGMISEHLFRHSVPDTYADSDIPFLAGALCDVGKVVSAVAFPDATDTVFRLTQSLESPMNWLAAEQKLECVGHVALGELACVIWGLPPGIVESCVFHNTPIAHADTLDKKGVPVSIAECVTFANEISKVALFESSLCLPEVLKSCLQRHGLDRVGFDRLVDECRVLFRERVDGLLSLLSQ